MIKYSWKVITYGRVDRIVEILHSFLIQEDNSDCEMVIVNDYPLQKLIFDHPKVKIYNLDRTFDTIGEKENFTIERCTGEVIVVADDDDIALPWHMNNIRQYNDYNIIHWQRGVYYNEPTITAITSIGNSGIVYTKDVWEKIGKSPIMNAGGDSILTNKIHNLDKSKVIRATPKDDKVSWFYRWGSTHNPSKGEIGLYHQSGNGTDSPDRPNIIQRHSEYIENQRKQGNIPVGDIYLIPRWKYNYIDLLKSYLNVN